MFKLIYVIVAILEASRAGGVVAVARVKDFRNKAVVLNSVYDVMKDNLRQPSVIERSDLTYDPRYKRNDQQQQQPQDIEYLDAIPSESGNE